MNNVYIHLFSETVQLTHCHSPPKVAQPVAAESCALIPISSRRTRCRTCWQSPSPSFSSCCCPLVPMQTSPGALCTRRKARLASGSRSASARVIRFKDSTWTALARTTAGRRSSTRAPIVATRRSASAGVCTARRWSKNSSEHSHLRHEVSWFVIVVIVSLLLASFVV